MKRLFILAGLLCATLLASPPNPVSQITVRVSWTPAQNVVFDSYEILASTNNIDWVSYQSISKANSYQVYYTYNGTNYPYFKVVEHVQLAAPVYVVWDEVTNTVLKNYNVYFGIKSGKYNNIQPAGDAKATINGLTVGKDYFFAIKAVNIEGVSSDFSQEVTTVAEKQTTASQLLASQVVVTSITQPPIHH